jgi:ABC-type sugar transport system permease subunit
MSCWSKCDEYGIGKQLGGDEPMPTTSSPEQQSTEHRTPEQHPWPEADYSDNVFLSREALEERYLHNASPSDGFIGAAAYERLLTMSPAVVLAVLWLAGMALYSSCVLLLYVLGTSLAWVVAGA